MRSRLKKKNLPTNIECYDVGIDVHNTDFSAVYDENEMTREISVPKAKATDSGDDIATKEIDISALKAQKTTMDTKSGDQTVIVPIKVSKVKKDK